MARDQLKNVSMAGRTDLHTILIVEDDAENAETLKTFFESKGFRISVAKDGGQAHGAAAMSKPDFVITKIILPGESGFEICERMKLMDKYMPVMMLTEIDLDASRNLSARVGADGYLTKPYDTDTLLQMVREIADSVWHRANSDPANEKGRIRFRCKCGQKFNERMSNRGKSISCPQCGERITIPEQTGQARFYASRSASSASGLTNKTEPLQFVTVKCQHCSTFYQLFSDAVNRSKTCPKCGQDQVGSLSIVGAPMSRAALASSLRVLRILTGKHKGKKLLLPQKEVVLGSDAGCDIRNASSGVGPKHCTLRPVVNGLLVSDLGSKTGTAVDGVQIQEETLLRPGGILKVGMLRFELIGNELDEDDAKSSVQKWTKEEEMARKRGMKLFNQSQSTAHDAAEVIQLYWEMCRTLERPDAEEQFAESDMN